MSAEAAIVLLSGGQDSMVCLAWALQRYAHVETVGFAYGQRHEVELRQRQILLEMTRGSIEASAKLGPDTVLDLPALSAISDTALTRDSEISFADTGLPTTFVPGRNLLFLTYAAALAYRHGISTLVGGMCETDYSGYPDCRQATIDAIAHAISLGMDRPIRIETPLMFLDKAGIWALAHSLGGDALVGTIVEYSHTCYRGDRSERHDWRYGCGTCPACVLRAKGWQQWRARTYDN